MPRTVAKGILSLTAWLALGIGQAMAAEPSPEPWKSDDPRALRAATYEIFARHGRPFAEGEWQTHFGRFDWYKADPAYSDDRLNDEERLALRRVLRQRLALAGPGEQIDRPLWQVEKLALDKPAVKAYQPAVWPMAGSLLCVIVFIFWRKARIPAMIGFTVTAVIIGRHVGQVEQAKDDAQLDTAYLIRAPIDATEPMKEGLKLVIGDKTYSYKGNFPFRAGEIATLAVSGSGQVLVANGRRVLPKSMVMVPGGLP